MAACAEEGIVVLAELFLRDFSVVASSRDEVYRRISCRRSPDSPPPCGPHPGVGGGVGKEWL